MVGAGLFLGKVGSMIHIGAALADNLLKLKIFRSMRNNKTLRVQLIACGCALGVGAVFGTPAGGVLFALEAVGTYYSLRNYLKNFYVALLAAFVSRLLHSLHDLSILLLPVYDVSLVVPSYTIIDFFTLALLGVVMGLLGVLFSVLNEKLLWLRNKIGRRYFLFFRRKHFKMEDPTSKFRFLKYPLTFVQTQFLWAVLICIVTSILCYPSVIGKFMSISPNAIIEDLMLNKPLLKENGAKGDWLPASLSAYISENYHGNTLPAEYYQEVFKNLGIFILVRFILSPLTVSLPIPGCIYVTLLIMGAGFGRFYGEFVAWLFPEGWASIAGVSASYSLIHPGAYAIVGAVALSASATQAFSTVFIFLEIAGYGIYWPSMLASIIAVKISRALYYSAYDAMIKLRGFPALLETKTDSEDLKVRDIMKFVDELIVLEETTTFSELKEIFESKSVIPKTFPVVNSKKDLVLVGVVSVKQLQTMYQTTKDSIELEGKKSTSIPQTPTTPKPIDQASMVAGISAPATNSSNNMLLDFDFDDLVFGKDWVAEGDKIEASHEDDDDELEAPVNAQEAIKSIEMQEPALNQQEEKPIRLDYDTCQIAISDSTPAIVAHLLFSQLRLDDVFVLWMGRLIGQLHREVLIKKISDRKNLIRERDV